MTTPWFDPTDFGVPPVEANQSGMSAGVRFGNGFPIPQARDDATLARWHEHLNNFLSRQYLQPDWSRFVAQKPGSTPFEMTANNEVVLRKFERELRTSFTQQEFWIVNVPSSAEQLGHHSAWHRHDGQWVEPEYAERLRGAYRLLHAGVVRYIFVSGGSIIRAPRPHDGRDDPRLPNLDYLGTSYPYNVDAMCGRQFLLDNFSAHWDAPPSGSDLASLAAISARQDLRPERQGQHDRLDTRIIVDNYAMHTESNVRNCDRLCAWLGLERNLISTTFAKPALKYAQGDGFTKLVAEGVTQVKFLIAFGYGEGSFHRLNTDIGIDGTRVPAGTGVFGDASHDFPDNALLRQHPFTAFALLIPVLPIPIPTRASETETEIGIILHHKLDLDSLRSDVSYQEQDH